MKTVIEELKSNSPDPLHLLVAKCYNTGYEIPSEVLEQLESKALIVGSLVPKDVKLHMMSKFSLSDDGRSLIQF